MAVEYYTARFLLQARARGHKFGRSLTVGRQNLAITPKQLQRLANEFSFESSTLTATQPSSALTYVEPFFTKLLGATEVESIDVSTYEGATYVHDLNSPLPAQFRSRYDTILEAGSLEHIFNFPTAIKNLMEALAPGGALLIQTPANNYMGHGFYQFSPELFYRIFSEENGFEIRRMQALEHFYAAHFFATTPHEVADPAKVGRRVQLVNNRPTLLFIEARKIAEKPIFARPPQQSDYVPLWKENASAMATPAQTPMILQPSASKNIYALPLPLVGHLWAQYLLARRDKPALSNRDFFKPAP